MNRFYAILFTQWKWSRLLLMLATFLAFAAPLVSIQGTNTAYGNFEIVATLQAFGVVYPLLAAGLGLLLSLSAWSSDHRGRHVYALSLPIPRWNYVALRYLAGLLLIGLPVIAIWLGGLAATRAIDLREGLHPYAGSLALRFGLAALLAYTAFFAISSGTPRMAGIVLGCCAAIIVVNVMLAAAGVEINIIEPIVDRLFIWPGPFEIFTGRWMLIDV
jgi:hypothetical protein